MRRVKQKVCEDTIWNMDDILDERFQLPGIYGRNKGFLVETFNRLSPVMTLLFRWGYNE